MKETLDSPEFRLSQSVYAQLLRAYPRSHRDEYGKAMAQLFRDQCRDAWKESRNWGLFKLWLCTVPDLVSTSILERIAALKERKTMSAKLASLLGFRVTPVSMFFRVFVVVFLMVFILSVAITYILPESYASTARIEVEPDAPAGSGSYGGYYPDFLQTTFEIIQSEVVLKPVVDKLKLNTVWGRKYFNGEPLKTAESIKILRQRLELAPVKNTGLISITAYSDDRNEAAEIANAIAGCYKDYRIQSRAAAADQGLMATSREYANQEQMIQQAQTDLNTLQKKFGIIENTEALSAQLASSRESLNEKGVELSELRSLNDEKRLNALPSIAGDTALSDLLKKLDDAEQQYATLTNDYSAGNVQVTRVTSLIDVLHKQINERVEGLMAGLESQIAVSKTATDSLAAELQRSKPTAENQSYWETKRNLDQLMETHKILYGKIEEQKLDAALPKNSLVSIVDSAEPGFAPVKPNKPMNIILGGVIGMFLAIGAGTVFALVSFVGGKRMRGAAIAA